MNGVCDSPVSRFSLTGLYNRVENKRQETWKEMDKRAAPHEKRQGDDDEHPEGNRLEMEMDG